MTYTGLVRSGDKTIEMRRSLIGSDIAAVTIQIPKNFGKTTDRVAFLKTIAFSARTYMHIIEKLLKGYKK